MSQTINLPIAAALCLLAAFAHGGVIDEAAFQRKMRVTFSGCGVTENDPSLDNFPALVTLDPARLTGFNYTDFTSPEDGADLRFADASGNELNYEIDTWNTNGVSLVWVQVPAMRSDAVVTAYWGGDDTTAPAYRTNGATWFNGYIAVWHFNGSALPVTDSTSNKNNFTNLIGNVTLGTSPAGGVGKVAAFAGGRSCLMAGNASSLSNMQKLTIELLAYDAVGGDSDAYGILSKRQANANQTAYSLFKNTGSMHLDIGTTSNNRTTLATAPTKQTWHHLATVFDGSQNLASRVLYYVNATPLTFTVAAGTPATVPASTSPLYLGILDLSGTEARGWNGYMDEVRLSNVARSAAWIAASRKTMTTPETFASYSPVEMVDLNTPIVASLESLVEDETVTVYGSLIRDGSSAATVTLYFGASDGGKDTQAWDDSRACVVGSDGAMANVFALPDDLAYGQRYFYRHYAANASTNAWAAQSFAFTTPGVATLGEPSAQQTGRSVTFSVPFVSMGKAPADVTCWLGESPALLTTQVGEWTSLSAPQTLSCTDDNLPIGHTIYYAFKAVNTMPDATANLCTIWTATNAIAVSGESTWTAGGGADTDWHTAANWDNGIPGAAARANFYAADKLITATSGLVVSQAMVNATGTTTFNLGANTLRVADRLDIGGNALSGYSAAGNSSLRLAAGMIDLGTTGSLHLGQTTGKNSFLIDSGATANLDMLTIGSKEWMNTNLVSVAGCLRSKTLVVGAGNKTKYNSFIVNGGSVTNTGSLWIGGGNIPGLGSVAETQDNSVILDNASLVNQGDVNMGYAYGGHRNRFLVTHGSRVTVGATLTVGAQMAQYVYAIVSNSTLTAGNLRVDAASGASYERFVVHQDEGKTSTVNVTGKLQIGSGGNDCAVIVNHGRLTVAGDMETGTWSGSKSGLIISNGTFSARNIYLNMCATVTAIPQANFMSVCGDSASVTSATLRVGTHHGPSNSLNLEGGRLALTGALDFGYNTSPSNRLSVAGATSLLTAASMTAKNTTTLTFDIPNEGFVNPAPVAISGTASLDNTTSVIINVRDFLGDAVLITAATINVLPEKNFAINLKPGRHANLYQTGTELKIKVIHDASFFMLR